MLQVSSKYVVQISLVGEHVSDLQRDLLTQKGTTRNFVVRCARSATNVVPPDGMGHVYTIDDEFVVSSKVKFCQWASWFFRCH